jgi:nucleotide-binding universal stress UspA family protein
MFANILVPTDGSEFSAKLIKDAVDLARASGARITALHAYPKHRISPYGQFGPSDDVVARQVTETALADADRFLDRIEQAARPAGVKVERAIVQNDDPWRAIVDTAAAKGCDLIMMAAHGRRGLVGLVLGSETNKVLTHSKIPVLVYR